MLRFWHFLNGGSGIPTDWTTVASALPRLRGPQSPSSWLFERAFMEWLERCSSIEVDRKLIKRGGTAPSELEAVPGKTLLKSLALVDKHQSSTTTDCIVSSETLSGDPIRLLYCLVWCCLSGTLLITFEKTHRLMVWETWPWQSSSSFDQATPYGSW